MDSNTQRDAKKFLKQHDRKKRRIKLLSILACVVVFCTTYALILPAVTLEDNSNGVTESTSASQINEKAKENETIDSNGNTLQEEKEQSTAQDEHPSQKENESKTAETQHFLARAPAAAGEDEAGNVIEISSADDWAQLQNGGEFKLTADISTTTALTIASGKNTTLDLNGHKVTYAVTSANVSPLITVNGGGTLTIDDSTDPQNDAQVTDEKELVQGNLNGNIGSVTDNADGSKTIIYYVTESTANGDGTTTEQLYKHTVTVPPVVRSSGEIICEQKNDSIISVIGGTLNVKGGTFNCKSSHILKGDRGNNNTRINIEGGYFTGAQGEALYMNGGIMNISGGAVIGNTDSSNGGAGVYAHQGTINISGGVIANNSVGSNKNGGAVFVRSGALNISGGVIAQNTAASGGGVYTDGSATLTISGGYIAGNTATNGGGVYKNGNNPLNLTGGVVADNTARNDGGGIYKNNGTITVSGGTVASNRASISSGSGGGGIFVNSGTMNMRGGYVTNNTASRASPEGNGSYGGAGIYMTDNSRFNMSAGYITGNTSNDAGGGLYMKTGTFNMTGGTVASNVTNRAEGGGMRLGSWSDRSIILRGTIDPTDGEVYITNNRTNTSFGWGGGGVFVPDGSVLTVKDSLITQNSAGGFGGGVSGCSTGRTYDLEQSGTAIYNNTAAGTNLTPSTPANKKPEDRNAANNAVFMNSGYQDFFCAMNSIVFDSMLGGGHSNWKGSCDYHYIEIPRDGMATSGAMMGLTSNPTNDSIAAAKNTAKVYVTGNSSHNHGGGLMSNGILMLGTTQSIDITPGLGINGTKSFRVNNAKGVMAEGQFTFLLLDEKPAVQNGKVIYNEDSIVSSDTNDDDGTFLFYRQFKEPGTYTYYMIEKPGGDKDISYDTEIYTITVTVAKSPETANIGSSNITLNYYTVTDVTVTNESGNNIPVTKSNINAKNHTASVTIGNDNTAAFKNEGLQPRYFSITKKDDNAKFMSGVKFTMRDSELNDVTPILSDSGTTDYKGQIVYQVERNKTYYIYETVPSGYLNAGPWIVEISSDGDTATIYKSLNSSGKLQRDESTPGQVITRGPDFFFNYEIVNTSKKYELPKTGGCGTIILYSTGGILILSAVFGYTYILRRKKKRGADEK